MLTEAEWEILECYLEPNPEGILALLSEKDRELAKAICKRKAYLGPLGMIEVGIVLGRMLRDMEKPR